MGEKMSELIKYTSDATYEQDVLQSALPVIVDFWPLVRPCKMIAPIFEELAKEYAGKVNFVKMNTDDNMDTPHIAGYPWNPDAYRVRSAELAWSVSRQSRAQIQTRCCQ